MKGLYSGLNSAIIAIFRIARTFVCVDVLRPSQPFFSHVGTEPLLPEYNQYSSGSKCVFAQGHNTAEVELHVR